MENEFLIASEETADYSSLDMYEALLPYFCTPEQHFFAFETDKATFLRMDRAAYHHSVFLDRRISALDPTPSTIPIAPLIEAAQTIQAPPVGWIFHIAHCGSTLLSRLLDQSRSSLILREPLPLRQLGISGANGDKSVDWIARLRLAHTMAARRFEVAQPTVVKANVPVNFIIPQILCREQNAATILLHFALEPYLLAILRTSGHRAWVDRVTTQLAPALEIGVGLRPSGTTAERAAALWFAQMLLFEACLCANPAARSLDAEVLFEHPAKVADAAAKHFSISTTGLGANLRMMTSSYSKDISIPFENASRLARRVNDTARLQHDIEAARRWISQSAAVRRLPDRLDRPLCGSAPRLLGAAI